jgi:hypothetical protein
MNRRLSWRACGLGPLLGWCAFVACGEHAPAQCATAWLPGVGVPGTDGIVHAMTLWDPDGAGPAQPLLAVAGKFRAAGSAVANGIAFYDPVSGAWSAPASDASFGTTIFALAALRNGDLVAAGDFVTAGTRPCPCDPDGGLAPATPPRRSARACRGRAG